MRQLWTCTSYKTKVSSITVRIVEILEIFSILINLSTVFPRWILSLHLLLKVQRCLRETILMLRRAHLQLFFPLCASILHLKHLCLCRRGAVWIVKFTGMNFCVLTMEITSAGTCRVDQPSSPKCLSYFSSVPGCLILITRLIDKWRRWLLFLPVGTEPVRVIDKHWVWLPRSAFCN